MVLLFHSRVNARREKQFETLLRKLHKYLAKSFFTSYHCLALIVVELFNAKHIPNFGFHDFVCNKQGVNGDDYLGLIIRRVDDELNFALTYVTYEKKADFAYNVGARNLSNYLQSK